MTTCMGLACPVGERFGIRVAFGEAGSDPNARRLLAMCDACGLTASANAHLVSRGSACPRRARAG